LDKKPGGHLSEREMKAVSRFVFAKAKAKAIGRELTRMNAN